ncbi:MAG: flagellar basal body-associated FliL family protein, partial [Pseudomonadota bacterium]
SKLVFYPIPEILVNLNTGGGGSKMYLKLNVELELRAGADLTALEAVMPRIVDKFQLYLRELRLEDLQGSAGMFRIKEELLRRVNLAAKPVVVYDVLFKELVIQ